MTISEHKIVCSSDYKRIDRIIPLLHLKGDLTTELGGFFIFYANRQKFGYEKGSGCEAPRACFLFINRRTQGNEKLGTPPIF